jgi:hypothetical protein
MTMTMQRLGADRTLVGDLQERMEHAALAAIRAAAEKALLHRLADRRGTGNFGGLAVVGGGHRMVRAAERGGRETGAAAAQIGEDGTRRYPCGHLRRSWQITTTKNPPACAGGLFWTVAPETPAEVISGGR